MRSQVALFFLQGQVYALAVEEILVILQTPKIFSLPLLPTAVDGVLIHAGEAIPLLRLDWFLGEPVGSPCRFSYVVICSTEFGVVGLPVDKILHLVDWRKGQLEGGRDTAGGDGSSRTFVYEQVRYPLLDIERNVAELSLWDFRHPPPQGN